MRAGNHTRCTRRSTGGFTYVLVLLLVALMGLGLAVAGPRWSDAAQRDREDELLRIGGLYAQAITRYHEASPGSLKQYPPSLDSLLQDTRYVGTRRHLRKLYTDPMQPGQPFALVRGADGGIRGVHSTSEAQTLRVSLPPMDGVAEMPPASKYSEWIFLAKPQP